LKKRKVMSFSGIPVLICICLLGNQAGAQRFSSASIPAELKENVDAVVREDIVTWKITARDRSVATVRFVVTILNPNADELADIVVGYDKLIKLSKLQVNVYDQSGLLIRKVKSSEISDVSSFDGFTLFSDNRLKSIDVAQSTYPYTVEYEYEQDYKYLYHGRGSYALASTRTSTQYFRYEIIYPPALKPRHRVLNSDAQANHRVNPDGTESLVWEMKNVASLRNEPAGPSFGEICPAVIAAPTLFEFDGYAGDMSSWRGLSDWQMQVNKGRDRLPEGTQQKVVALTKDLKSTEEKAEAIYKYLQSKTRYVGIQLGIGGWQPFEASVVDEVGYGDCKALSNYMVSLLSVVGIKGYYTLVMAGRDEPPLMEDFPSPQFNHVIVSVPNGKDTLWLECTSQSMPFGYLGGFTGNRKAFMVTENGGKIVSTERYPAEENTRQRRAMVTLQTSGDAKAQVTTTYAGLRYEAGGLSSQLDKGIEDQKKWMLDNIRLPNFNLDQFKMTDNKRRAASAQLDMTLALPRYASVSGKRIFVVPNLMSRSSYVPEAVTARSAKVVVKTGFVDIDTIVYTTPESIYPEFVPKAIRHESRFGTYEATFVPDQGKLVYTRRLVVKEGVFPPESYQEYIDFYKHVSRADNTKLVFLSKT
jgi:transglutaminase-like putative cysteine protease